MAAGDVTYIDTGESEAELLAQLPAAPDQADDMLVVTSLRIPLRLHTQLKAYAATHGTRPSVLILQGIELHLAAGDDRHVRLDDVIRAVSGLPPAA